MCGIAGKLSPGGVTADELRQMAAVLEHRGPDEYGWYAEGPVGLASQRLSIIDLEKGSMPLSNEDRSIWVVFNGEIYNHQQLREELKRKGHTFRSHSDTEVIVHLYEELGSRCVERLGGMFAFALWDSKRRRLMLARDRIGQKPLFYAGNGAQFLFASEVKGILAAMDRSPDLDLTSMHHYLSLRFIPPPGTMFRGINKLPPAHILVHEDGRIRVERYWELSYRKKQSLTAEETLEGLAERLRHTVKSHLISDVPVGAMLSGGLDSSMIVAIAMRDLGAKLDTFGIGVTESDFDELPFARVVADRLGSQHHERCVSAALVDGLPEIIRHLDEPSDPIAACQYQAAKLAAEHVKVALGGDGGDELFGGFDRYAGLRYVDYFARLPRFVRVRLARSLTDSLGDSFAYKNLTQQLRWIQQLSQTNDYALRYALATTFFRFGQDEKKRLYGERLRKELGDIRSTDIITKPFDGAPADDLIDRMLYTDFVTRLPEHSLMLTDRMSMAHSLELRSPYLDHELVEFMAMVPGTLKVRGRKLKFIFREMARDYLPKEITTRKKQGFMFPLAYWFRDELHSLIREMLLRSFFVTEGMFDRSYITDLLDEHRSGRADHHVRLWMLLNLEVWHRLYLRNVDPQKVAHDIRASA